MSEIILHRGYLLSITCDFKTNKTVQNKLVRRIMMIIQIFNISNLEDIKDKNIISYSYLNNS